LFDDLLFEGKVMLRKHIPQLDGLRALAVALVLVAHSAVGFDRFLIFGLLDKYGSLGVQIFFVLSGFLITRILLQSKTEPHFFRNFFVRRGLRIYPLYYAVLAFIVFSGIVHQHGVHWWVYACYLSNIVDVHRVQPAPLGPVWSLAVEEQFYCVWPFVVWALNRRAIERLSLVTIFIVTVLRLTLHLHPHNTLLQLDALAAGSLIACRSEQLARWRRPALVIACMMPIGMGLPEGVADSISQSIQVISSAAFLVLLIENRGRLASVFSAAFPRYIGKISYGIYLLHSLVFAAFLRTATGNAVTRKGSLLEATLFLLFQYAIVIAVASGSFYVYERPFLALKRCFEADSHTLPVDDNESLDGSTTSLEQKSEGLHGELNLSSET
jgi:peptidoglycan/LPS O-acetylase OafA/YrhL